MCECCDGFSNPKVSGNGAAGRLLFCIRGTLLVMRGLDLRALPQWILSVNYCPMCGRDLRGDGE